MPRHFLVKRHKHCTGTFSYRDRVQIGAEGAEGTEKISFPVLDSDKYSGIRDGDYISDYSCYGSPDSGYSASPNSAHVGFAREKDNQVTDRENNNNTNIIKTTSVNSYYDNSNMTTSSIESSIYCKHRDEIHEDDTTDDTPIDLSMPSKKPAVPSSEQAYLQEEIIHQHRNYHQQQQQQQQHIYSIKPPHINYPVTTSTTAAVAFCLDSNQLYANNNTTNIPPCVMMHSLSPIPLIYNSSTTRHLPLPDARASPLYARAIKPDILVETQKVVGQTDIMPRAQCLYIPSPIRGHRPSSSISAPASPRPTSTTALEAGTTNERATPLNSPSPLHSPNRKRGIPDTNDELSSEYYILDFSKSLAALKKRDRINDTTPISKTTTLQKAKTAPAAKKSPGSVPSGKRLKAVRRLNFDIDTTSPVSGTIIKDAADFHPDDGKVVYGDIEPTFNFVEVTPEARAELDKIENKIGAYICQLCKEYYEDAFQLAQHRCSRIIHVEYRCPECEKVFNCPANLASHRRWHKPRVNCQSKLGTEEQVKTLTNQKIAPKTEFSSNNITEVISKITMKREASPDAYHVEANHISTNNQYNTVTEEIQRAESVSYQQHSTTNFLSNRNYSPSFKNAEDELRLSILSNKSECKENGIPVYVDVSQPPLSPHVGPLVQRSATKTSYSYTSSEDQDSLTIPDSVISVAPSHPSPVTYGSSLTSEERSLVLQVLSCHNRQHQPSSTTSTTTTTTPYISGTHSSSPTFNIKTCDATETNDKKNRIHNILSQDTTDSLLFSLSSSTSSSSPSSSISSSPPLDLTQSKETHQHSYHYQQPQHQTALSEHQTNSHIGCPVCGKKFQRQAYLRKHILSQHSKPNNPARPSNGTDDDKMTNDSSDLTSTQFIAENVDQRSHSFTNSCSVCCKDFSSESARIKHESMTHGLTAILTCNSCCLTFTSKTSLDKHSRYAHATETFSCKYCSSTFHSSPGLTRHINKCHPTENRRVILLQMPAARTC